MAFPTKSHKTSRGRCTECGLSIHDVDWSKGCYPLVAATFQCTKCAENPAHGTTCQGCGGQHCDNCCMGSAQTIFGFPVKYDDTLPENVVLFQERPTNIPVRKLSSLGITVKQAAEAMQRLIQQGKVAVAPTMNSLGQIVETSLVPVPATPASKCENCDAVGPTHLHSPNEISRNRLCDQCCIALGGPANPCSKWSPVTNHPTCIHGSAVPHSYGENAQVFHCAGPVLDSHGNPTPAAPGTHITHVRLEPPKDRQFALAEDDE